MDFNDIVKKNLKTKGEIEKENKEKSIEAHNQTVIAAANYNYERIKNEIIENAKTGKAQNGTITGIYQVETGLSSYDERDIPYHESFFDIVHNSKGKKHDLFIVAWENHHLSAKIKKPENVQAMFNLMKEYAKEDGIELIDIFMWSVVRKNNKIVRQHRFSINAKSYVSYKTDWQFNGESGSIYLAIEYQYIIKP